MFLSLGSLYHDRPPSPCCLRSTTTCRVYIHDDFSQDYLSTALFPNKSSLFICFLLSCLCLNGDFDMHLYQFIHVKILFFYILKNNKSGLLILFTSSIYLNKAELIISP